MADETLQSRPLRVMTYNVRYFGHATRGLVSTAQSLHRIAGAIAALDPLPDVVCLQEVETASLRSTLAHRPGEDGATQLQRLMTALHRALRHRGVHDVFDAQYFSAHDYRITPKTSFYTTGLAMLIRRPLRFFHHNAVRPHDITHRRVRSVREDGTKGMKQTRICAHAVVETEGGMRFDLFNTHLSLPAFFKREFWTKPRRMGWGKNQLEEARLLAYFVAREKTSGAFLVMGDFNALPGSPVYDFLTTECAFADPLFAALGRDMSRLQSFPTAGFMHLRMHLDHLLSGPGIRWHDVEGSYPFGDPKSPFSGLSDHAPIVGRFSVEGGGAIEAPAP